MKKLISGAIATFTGLAMFGQPNLALAQKVDRYLTGVYATGDCDLTKERYMIVTNDDFVITNQKKCQVINFERIGGGGRSLVLACESRRSGDKSRESMTWYLSSRTGVQITPRIGVFTGPALTVDGTRYSMCAHIYFWPKK